MKHHGTFRSRRSFRAVRITGAVLAVWLACFLAEAGPAFRFAWLSDTHIGSETAAEDLRASVQDINSQGGLSFVIVSGDVTEYGSLEQLKAAKEILSGLKVPVHVLPGNHDTKWSESGATDFGRLWKEDRFVFSQGGLKFIGMHQGPLMKMGDGHWAPQDVRWLEKTLAQVKQGEPVVFVTHYPIDNGIANWFVVLDLLKKHNTQVVLCGHGHANRGLNFEGVPGVMGRSNLRARQAAGAYNLVEVTPDKMTFAEKAPGQKARPAWHSVALGPREYAGDTNAYPRPDFSVNQRYPEVRPRWSVSTGHTFASSPAVWKDSAIIGDASGTVYAFGLDLGAARWKFKTRNAVYATPAIAGDLAIVPSTDGTVYALHASTGRAAWRFPTPRPIVASPAVADGTVFVGSSERKFRALDAATGKLKWEFGGLRGFVETRPLVAEGKVIFGAWDGHLYCLDAMTGELAWKWSGDRPAALLSPAACWPVAAGGKVFIVAPDRKMTAIELQTGRQIWRTGDYGVRESIGLSADGSRCYVRAMNDLIYALSTAAAEPETIWKLDAGFGYDINSAMLAEKEGVVFYGTKNGLLLAMDAQTGMLLWEHKTGPGILNTVVPLSAKQVLAADFDGKIELLESQ
jgi:outer membrane protein assembly factor BamB/predicted phosphodiesterase